jgi:hypothetical protein
MKKEIEVPMLAEYDKDYVAELDSCRSLLELQKLTDKWKWIAEDAYKTTATMTPDDFKSFKKWRAAEKRGEFMGEKLAELYGPILMPDKMFCVTMVAIQFKVPWGVAYNQMKSVGRL